MNDVKNCEDIINSLSEEDHDKAMYCLRIIRSLVKLCPQAYLVISLVLAEIQDKLKNQESKDQKK